MGSTATGMVGYGAIIQCCSNFNVNVHLNGYTLTISCNSKIKCRYMTPPLPSDNILKTLQKHHGQVLRGRPTYTNQRVNNIFSGVNSCSEKA